MKVTVIATGFDGKGGDVITDPAATGNESDGSGQEPPKEEPDSGDGDDPFADIMRIFSKE